jgi:hypothetical protein
MNLLYNIAFNPASAFCTENFFDKRSSPSTLLIEENTISAIHHLLPASFSCFHHYNPSFLRIKTSSLRYGHPFDLVDALFLIFIIVYPFHLS